MTAPLTAAEDRARNRREWEAMRVHFQAQIEYHEREAAESRRMLAHLEKALAKLAERGEGASE